MRGHGSTPWRRALPLLLVAVALPGCDTTVHYKSRPRLPPPDIRFVDLAVVAAPVFRLVIPPDSPDEPSRLVAVHVHLRSRHPNPVVIRPERIRLLLPDGTLHLAFDPPRARELLARTQLARADLLYLDEEGSHVPPGGLTAQRRAALKKTVADELLAETRLEPGGRADGYVIIDTGRPFRDLSGLPLEVVTIDEAPPPKGTETVPLLARLSQARRPPE